MSDLEQYLPNESALRGMLLKDSNWSFHSRAMAAEILRLRAELAKASAEGQRLETAERLRSFSPPTAQSEPFTQAELDEATIAMADAPPADVLGEAFRAEMRQSGPSALVFDMLFEESLHEAKLRHLHAAVSELAQVVERIARAQRSGGGK